MADEIPEELVEKMMVNCGRRCCICRKFKPTKLQVHHIKERSKGGDNQEDNLIVTCISCHTDVHSKVPFARRFSHEELKGHRNALVKMLGEGKLPSDETDTGEVLVAILESVSATARQENSLTAEAIEILLKAVNAEGHEQGSVMVNLHFEGMTIQMGAENLTVGHDENRKQAKYKRAIKQLTGLGLLETDSGTVMDVTEEGYLAAEELMVAQGRH